MTDAGLPPRRNKRPRAHGAVVTSPGFTGPASAASQAKPVAQGGRMASNPPPSIQTSCKAIQANCRRIHRPTVNVRSRCGESIERPATTSVGTRRPAARSLLGGIEQITTGTARSR